MKKKLPDSLLFQDQLRKCDKRFVFCIGVFVSSCRKENTVLPIAADNSVLDALSFRRLVYTRDVNMAMGNPSNAKSTPNSPNNYLMIKPQAATGLNFLSSVTASIQNPKEATVDNGPTLW